jgi:hypothetical protein
MAKTYRERGKGNLLPSGYVLVYRNGVRRLEHLFVAEDALGKPLPRGAVVHHVDENKSNNIGKNLVICPSQQYHFLLHIRSDALDATGDPESRKCLFCKKWDSKENLFVPVAKQSETYAHRACMNEYNRERRSKNKTRVTHAE